MWILKLLQQTAKMWFVVIYSLNSQYNKMKCENKDQRPCRHTNVVIKVTD